MTHLKTTLTDNVYSKGYVGTNRVFNPHDPEEMKAEFFAKYISQSSSLLYKDITKQGVQWKQIPFNSDFYHEETYRAEKSYLSMPGLFKIN